MHSAMELLSQPAALTEWAGKLPSRDMTALSAQLIPVVAALPKANLNPTGMLVALEILRIPVYRLARGLAQPLLANAAGLNTDNQKSANTLLQLLNTLGTLYTNLVPKLHQANASPETIGVALHRSLFDHIALQQTYYQLYLPIPEKLWLKLHKRFLIATQLKLAPFVTEDPAYDLGNTPLTIQQVYAAALLLGCARVNQLSPKEIALTVQLLFRWAPLTQLDTQRASEAGNTFVVDISADTAPSFQAFASLGENAIPCYLRIDGVMARLKQLIDSASGEETPTPAGPVPTRLLKHLQRAWDQYIQREERIPTEEPVTVTTGLANIHYYLAGHHNAADFIGPQKMRLSIAYEADEDVALIESRRSGDVWSKFLSKEAGQLGFGEIPDSFHFQQRFEPDGPALPEHYPAQQAIMLDRSEHGCRLQWPSETDCPITIGDLLAFREANGHWRLGEIAWQRHESNGQLAAGIKLLSRLPIPLSAEKIMGMKTDDWLPMILLPVEGGLRDKPAALTPPKTFKSGDLVTICQKGIEKKVQLTERRQNHSGYQLFICGFVLDNA